MRTLIIATCLAIVSLNTTAASPPPHWTVRPVAQVEQDPTFGDIWRSASGDLIVVSDVPSRLVFSRGSIGTTFEASTPMGDSISRLEASAWVGDVLLVWARMHEEWMLVRSDGSAEGTFPLWRGYSALEQVAGSLTVCGSIGYFRTGEGVWRTDGTPSGTFMIAAVAARSMNDVGGTFTFLEGPSMSRGWTSDGTLAGTRPIGNWETDFQIGVSSVATVASGRLFWASGPNRNTEQLFTLTPSGPAVVGGPIARFSWISARPDQTSMFFVTNVSEIDRTFTVHHTSGQAEGTGVIGAFMLPTGCDFTAVSDGDRLFVRYGRIGGGAHHHRLQVFPAAGSPFWIGPTGDTDRYEPSEPAVARRRAFFGATDGIHGRELWTTDGTQSGTFLVADLRPGPQSAYASGAAPLAENNRVYFQARGEHSQRHFWVLDLCPADFNNSGTIGVEDVFGFVQGYLQGEDLADFDGDGTVAVDDLFGWLAAYFAGCPD